MVKGTTTSAYVVGGNRALAGLAKIGNGIYGSEVREDTLNPIRDMISPKYQDYYDGYEFATMYVVGEAAAFANDLNQGSQINTSFRGQKTPISSTRSLTDGKNYNVIKEISQGKVLINDGTPGGTTMAYQNRTTYPNGSMTISQKNLTTGEISFQGINSSGQRVFETSLTPHEANTLIGANSSSKMLVGNGAVSQSVISRVSYQTGNNSLVLYDKTPVPVATNGTLVAPLTINKALATVPLLTNGANQVSQVQNNRLALENTLIWNKITPVYPDISPTFIPRAFIIESNGKKFFVTPNATKHIAEDFIKKHYLADGSDINYALKNQILLKGFGAALDQITNSEIQYGKKYYTDNWEIMINKKID